MQSLSPTELPFTTATSPITLLAEFPQTLESTYYQLLIDFQDTVFPKFANFSQTYKTMFSQNPKTKFNRLLTYSNLVHPLNLSENHWLISLTGEVKKSQTFKDLILVVSFLHRLSRHCKWPVILPRLFTWPQTSPCPFTMKSHAKGSNCVKWSPYTN